MATVVPWLVLGIWCIAEFNNQNMITASHWWIALRYLLAFIIVFLVLVTYVWLVDRNLPSPFAPEEMARFERYRRFVHARPTSRHAEIT